MSRAGKPATATLASGSRGIGAALLLAAAFVALTATLSGTTEPRYDGIFYVKMAKKGLFPPEGLVAPFAYRPAVPLLARGLAEAADEAPAAAFRGLACAAAVALLLCIFLFARWLGAAVPGALAIMAVLGFYYFHVRHPLFFYSLVDIEAFPLMLLAVWALLAGRPSLCLALACVGLFFKEFLIVPAVLVGLEAVRDWKRSGWDPAARGHWGFALLALGLAAICVLAPRLLLPVSRSFQLVDPLNRPESLTQLVRKPFDLARDLNLAFALLCYWLPTLMLVTRERALALWRELGDWRVPAVVHLALILALALYGGSNVTTFVAYALPFQVVALALLLRRGVATWEVLVVLVAVFAFNKVPMAIPPLDGTRAALDAHVDFYAGWSSRVNAATAVRWGQLGLCLVALPGLRRARRRR